MWNTYSFLIEINLGRCHILRSALSFADFNQAPDLFNTVTSLVHEINNNNQNTQQSRKQKTDNIARRIASFGF